MGSPRTKGRSAVGAKSLILTRRDVPFTDLRRVKGAFDIPFGNVVPDVLAHLTGIVTNGQT